MEWGCLCFGFGVVVATNGDQHCSLYSSLNGVLLLFCIHVQCCVVILRMCRLLLEKLASRSHKSLGSFRHNQYACTYDDERNVIQPKVPVSVGI